MELILIPNTKDNKKDQESALKVCDWFSHGTPKVCHQRNHRSLRKAEGLL